MSSWKNALSLCLCLLACRFAAAEGADAAAGAQQSAAATPTPNPTAEQPSARPFRHILIADNVSAAETIKAAPDSPFVVLSPGLASFDAAELNKRLAAGVGRPIEPRILAAITQVIEGYFREHEYPAATAVVPSQNIQEGDVRIVLTLGSRGKSLAATEWKIRKINMQGARWFSEALLREKLRVEQGEIMRFSDLDQALTWTNNNPFRRVHVQFDPVPNTSGEADLTIAVQETMPLRLVAQYSNGGNDATGRNQYIAAVTYGNLWGRDHQITYQYITTDQPKFFQAHSLDYRIPLRWRHNLQINASYFRAKPEIFDGALVQNGETITSDLRYTIPLRTGDNAAEVFANLSFKESNNNLAFYGTQVFGSKTDIFQLTTGGSMVRRDSRGGWLLAASVTASPGNINSRNTDRAFDAGRFDPSQDSARYGAHARYAFATLSAQRFLTLKPGWDYSARAVVQASQSNLLSSEELGIGGASTVRGFPEGIFSGDNGYLLSNDLYLPTWKKNLPRISKTRGPLEVRPLLFLDMAKVGVHKSFSSDRPRPALSSTGAGVRMSLGTNFSLSADYGWQLSELPYKEEKPRRAHIRATLAY